MTKANLMRALEDAGRGAPRTKMINLRVTGEELALIRAAAKVYGLSATTFLRAAVFSALAELTVGKGGKRR